MARTPGSGWGAGPLNWQSCPVCRKKKVLYRYYTDGTSYFYCHACQTKVEGSLLERKTNK